MSSFDSGTDELIRIEELIGSDIEPSEACLNGFLLSTDKRYDFVSSTLSDDALGQFAVHATSKVIDVFQAEDAGSPAAPSLALRASLEDLPLALTANDRRSLQPCSVTFIDDFTTQSLCIAHLAIEEPSRAIASAVAVAVASRRIREPQWTLQPPHLLSAKAHDPTIQLHCILILADTLEVLAGGSIPPPSTTALPALALLSWPILHPSSPCSALAIPSIPLTFPGTAITELRLACAHVLLAITDVGAVLSFDLSDAARPPICLLQPPSQMFLRHVFPVGEPIGGSDDPAKLHLLALHGQSCVFLRGSLPRTDRGHTPAGRLEVLAGAEDPPFAPPLLPRALASLAVHDGIAAAVLHDGSRVVLWELGSGRKWGALALGEGSEVVSAAVRVGGAVLASVAWRAVEGAPPAWEGRGGGDVRTVWVPARRGSVPVPELTDPENPENPESEI